MAIESWIDRSPRCRIRAAAPPGLRAAAWLPVMLAAMSGLARAQTQPTQASTVPLILPAGLAYGSSGDLFFSESAAHVVRRVSVAGILTTVAGTGVQGFAGDGGAATSAILDSPGALAIDPAGNLFVADTHNHRIRRIDAATGAIGTVAGTGVAGESPSGTLATNARLDLPAALALDAGLNLFFADARAHSIRRIDHVTGLLTTVAGDGTEGFSGDGGTALSASLDTPAGLAVDPAGNIYLADTRNQRIRRIDGATGVITSVSGDGQPGFSGDQGAAGSATLRLPRGLALDSSGNLYLADSGNHRIRRIDSLSGKIVTIAGDGTQAFAGDFAPAVAASLDSPGAIALSPAGLPTLSDTSNQRVRQVDAAAVIHTLAGLGASMAGSLTLAGPSVVLYGTGAVTATLTASPATGSVTFFDTVASATQTLGAVALAGNAASFAVAALPAGSHLVSATYPGDTLHPAAQSGIFPLVVSPTPVTAAPASFDILYGQPVPLLTGTLAGVLPRDAASVTLALSTAAGALSPVAAYPIAASLAGAGSANYALTAAPAAVTIAKAGSLTTLTAGLAVHVAPSIAGVATGSVTVLDGASPYASGPLSAGGDATFSPANLSLGSHTLTALYAGDGNLLPSASTPAIVTIGGGASLDFTLAATGQSSVTVTAGNAASFSFAVSPVNGALSSPIQLTASGLPTGATASFNPAYLPPSNGPAAFILTIQTAKAADLLPLFSGKQLVYAVLLPLLLLGARKRRLTPLLAGVLAVLLSGCGDRVVNPGANSATARSYNVAVTGTATSATGATLQHTAGVTLTLQ